MKAPVSSRFVHSEGIVGITFYEGEGGRIVTCGSDDEIRLWKDPEDEKPLVIAPPDTPNTIACCGDTLYAGTESNCVDSFQLPSGEPLKVVAKFTAAVNHLDVSKSGSVLVAGSGDMTIQIIKLKESGSIPVKIEGHSAPVLAVLVDPKEKFVLSTGCDGCVCIWSMDGKQVKRWDSMFPSSNDISTSKTLCRPSWSKDGESIAVPKGNGVVVFSRDEWEEEMSVKVKDNTKMLSVVLFSSCQKYLAAGSTDGTLYIWNVESLELIYENFDRKDHIAGLLFSKCSKHIFAVDLKGRMIFVKDFAATHDTQDFESMMADELAEPSDDYAAEKDAVAEDDDPFNDDMDMDDMLADGGGDTDANEISISEIKAGLGFIASDKEDIFVGVEKAKKIAGIKGKAGDDDDVASVVSSSSVGGRPSSVGRRTAHYRPVPVEIPFTEPQKPFQPSSSPVQISHRFMVWNSIGIIRNYEIEVDDLPAIDIDFHDVIFHNGIHLRNQHDYTIAALGKEAVIFASSAREEGVSKVMCLHFSSWDSNKEWTTELPKEEEATTAAIGTGWFAIGTSSHRIRIFTTGGVQRNVIDIGGQIIAMSGHEDLLLVTFHTGIGLYGNQAISYSILRIRTGTGLSPLISGEPLPLSPQSEVRWVGFSDEGTPATSDSKDVVRILHGRLWTTFLNMKQGSRNESDHYWLTGLSICNQHVRVVKCKGTTYPPTLPRPTIMILDAKLPLCEMETEKSQLEDVLLRSVIQNMLAKKMDKKGYDAEQYKDKSDRDIKENLMRLFAMCCKADKDFRASEYVTMMLSTHSIQVAIKYANKLRKMALTDRLTAIGRKRLDEEEEGVEEHDDDFETVQIGNVIYSSIYSNFGRNNGDFGIGESSESVMTNHSSDVVFLEENPLLTKQRSEIQGFYGTPGSYKNPFKKNNGNEAPSKTSSSAVPPTESKSDAQSGKGLSLIDAWKKPSEKPAMEFNPKHPKAKGSKKADKKAADNDKTDKKTSAKDKADKSGKKQTTLFDMAGRKSTADKEPENPAAIIDEVSNSNSDSLHANGDSEIPETERDSSERKRKRSSNKEDDSDKRSRITSKLSAFALRREDNDDTEELGDV